MLWLKTLKLELVVGIITACECSDNVFDNSHIVYYMKGECSEHVCDNAHCFNDGACTAVGPDSSVCLCPRGVVGHSCESSRSILSHFAHSLSQHLFI